MVYGMMETNREGNEVVNDGNGMAVIMEEAFLFFHDRILHAGILSQPIISP